MLVYEIWAGNSNDETRECEVEVESIESLIAGYKADGYMLESQDEVETVMEKQGHCDSVWTGYRNKPWESEDCNNFCNHNDECPHYSYIKLRLAEEVVNA